MEFLKLQWTELNMELQSVSTETGSAETVIDEEKENSKNRVADCAWKVLKRQKDNILVPGWSF